MRPQSIILAAVLLLAACGTTATPTPDVRAGLLADLSAYQARFGQCINVGPETGFNPNRSAEQSFLLGHPELNRYATWVGPRYKNFGACMDLLRDDKTISDYIKQR